jgi:hypothetical protein
MDFGHCSLINLFTVQYYMFSSFSNNIQACQEWYCAFSICLNIAGMTPIARMPIPEYTKTFESTDGVKGISELSGMKY